MVTFHRSGPRRDRPGEPAAPGVARARVWRVLVRGIGYASVGWLLAALTPPADSAPIEGPGCVTAERVRTDAGSACPVPAEALAVAAAGGRSEVGR